MSSTWRVLAAGALGVAVLLGLWARPAPPPPAEAQDVGIFSRASCSQINAPAVGESVCFDQTANTWKVYTGAATNPWVSLTATQSGVNNVRDFGAACDGATDDAAAIAGAIAALPTTGSNRGGTVLFPIGTCVFASTITLPTNVILRGAGGISRAGDIKAATILKYTGAGSAIQANGGSYWTIRDLGIQVTAGTIGLDILDGGGENGGTVENVVMVGPASASSTAIRLSASGLNNCICHNAFRHLFIGSWQNGIVLSGPANANYFEQIFFAFLNGWAYDFTATGTDTNGGADNLVVRSEIDSSVGNGIRLGTNANRNAFVKTAMENGIPTGLTVGSGALQTSLVGVVLNGTVTDSSTSTVYVNVVNGPTQMMQAPIYTYASATFANTKPASVASATGQNLLSVRGISATQSIANNLRGSCTFAAASTCAVAFASNEPDAAYFITVVQTSGTTFDAFRISSKAVSGFTINASQSNSNSVDWHLIR